MGSRFGRILQVLFFLLIVKPILLVILGLRVQGRDNLPVKGPAILIANHNSHLDTLVMMNLFPFRRLHKLRPVAAADYFLADGLRAWFSQTIINIIPIVRTGEKTSDPLDPVYAALSRGEIVIFYPEGSRGEPEKISGFRKGIAKLCKKFPDVPVYPVFTHGLGKSLPKGEAVFVPFFCDVIIGKPSFFPDCKDDDFAAFLEEKLKLLKKGRYFADWDNL